MALELIQGAELIPGYQLIEKLGTGGYGSVWKTTAPGGLLKAIKVVFGEAGGQKADQELKALQRIKEVRHPFLLSLERIETLDGHLLIVTELAEESLWDRFSHLRQEGLWGVPRDELLAYLRDAADALDYMSEAHGLQHLDVKPQNMLLVGGRIKVADFGLVKNLFGTSVTATGGVTPIYAPPEAFDGRVSRHSDQYSLAIVYQEMLTGVRPFPGATVMQLAQQHLHGRPLLDPLPAADRPVMARALARAPDKRYPNCRTFVERLQGASPSSLARAADPAEVEGIPPATVPAAMPGSSEGDSPPANVEGFTAAPRTVPIDVRPTPPAETGLDSQPSSGDSIAVQPGGERTHLRPTLFLGVGGLACATLRCLKQKLLRRCGDLEATPILRLLQLDTDRAALRAACRSGLGEPLLVGETLPAPLQAQDHYREKARDYLRWLDRRWLYGIPRSQTTEGIRPLGRLAFVDNAADILNRLREELRALTSAESTALTLGGSGMSLRDEAPRVFLVASITGATGGGMLIGMAYAIQQILAELRLSAEGVCGLLLYASSPKPGEVELAAANARATLQEINHFSSPDNPYPGDPEHGLKAGEAGQAPFADCYLVHLGTQRSKEQAEVAADVVAEYLSLDATTAGPFLDHYRLQTRPPTGPPCLRTFGVSRIHFPRRELADLAARQFCCGFLQRRRGDLADLDKPAIQQDARRKAIELGLVEETLLSQLQLDADAFLGKTPDYYFARLAAPPGNGEDAGPRKSVASSPGAIIQRVEEALGAGPQPEGRPDAPPSSFELQMLHGAEALGTSKAKAVVDWLRDRVENKESSLKAVEIACACLNEHLRTTADSLAVRLAQLRSRRSSLRSLILKGGAGGKRISIPWLMQPLRQRNAEKRTVQLLDYCWARLAEVLLEAASRALGVVTGELSPLVQELAVCQSKLKLLVEQFPRPVQREPTAVIPTFTEVRPGGAANREEAAAAVLARLSPATVGLLEESLQIEILDPQGGVWALLGDEHDTPIRGPHQATSSLAFWNLVSDAGDVSQKLTQRMMSCARGLMLDAMNDLDAAQLFLQSAGDDRNTSAAAARQLEAARPQLLVPGGWQHLVLLVPPSPDGAALVELVSRSLGGATPVSVQASESDVFFCFEAAGQPLASVARALAGEGGDPELAPRLLTRNDVKWSPLRQPVH
jgi:hypothetical protein